jgi:hypothetical protein
LADKIYTLLTDSHCRQRLGEQARHHAQRYDWAHIVEQMLVLYAKVINQQ